jgi:hypothetical protein
VTREPWPALPLEDWQDTYATLHLWTQIVGKTAVRMRPMQNHWWQVAFRVTARGLAIDPMPWAGGRTLGVAFDFLDHRLVLETSEGATRTLALEPMSVSDFHARYLERLRELGIGVRLHSRPNEMAEAIPFAEDTLHAAYDPDAARRCWEILVQGDRVLRAFRGRFVGKSSPSHFWWGGFDLSCTRFSGRPAPPHPGGFPHLPDAVTRESYSHECISAGWWPGSAGGPVREPAFYAYAYPEPEGCPEAPIGPAEASYHLDLHEWVLPYEAVRGARDPDAKLLEFLQSTYEAAATLGGWDRAALEATPRP